MQIRLATTRDCMSILALQYTAYRSWRDSIDFVPALADSNRNIYAYVESNRAWVIEMDNAIVGVTCFNLNDSIADICKFAIHPIHQRHGLGKHLLKKMEDTIIAQGGYMAEFRIPSSIIPAQRFLDTCGYNQCTIDEKWLLFRKQLASPPKFSHQQYERIGECQQCGKCCSRIFLMRDGKSLTPQDVEDLGERLINDLNEFTKAVGVDYAGRLEDGTAYFRCRQLSFDQEGKAICKLYNQPNRPPVCSMFPVSPSAYKYLSCGFVFVEKTGEKENGS